MTYCTLQHSMFLFPTRALKKGVFSLIFGCITVHVCGVFAFFYFEQVFLEIHMPQKYLGGIKIYFTEVPEVPYTSFIRLAVHLPRVLSVPRHCHSLSVSSFISRGTSLLTSSSIPSFLNAHNFFLSKASK